MKKEQWDFITENWSSDDPVVMETIAKYKDEDTAACLELENKIKERDEKILELTQKNADINNTNLKLMLRLTDPAITNEGADREEDEYEAPALDDYDSFIKED